MAKQMKNSGIDWIGDVPIHWSISKMKYIGNYINGYAFKPEDWSGSGKRIIRIQDLTRYNDNPNYYEGEIDNKYLVKSGDILVSWAATLDAYKWQHEDGWLNQHIFKATPNEALVRYDYFYWLIKEAMHNMANENLHGIMMQHVTLGLFGNYSIPLPPISEQQKIAETLYGLCSEIDKVIEKTKTTIEEYKKLKQSIITDAVTKGIHGYQPMKDSGVEWIGKIPVEWNVYRIANLYDERSENGSEELPILTVSINSGVSDHEIADEDKNRVFIRSEDRTKYKRVYPGDLTYNMMRAWQGAFGAVRVNGMVSPAYVVAKPKNSSLVENRYLEALLRTSKATEEMHRYSRGIVDFRLRLYWPEFRNIKICLPSLEEQIEIAEYIDKKVAEIDTLIAKKTTLLEEMESYKKSVIYEYVTGKKECGSIKQAEEVVTIYPHFPAVLSTDKTRFAQAILMSRILDKCRKKMGRVKLEKMLYTIENSIGFDFETEYAREAAGPFDSSIYECERIISRRNKWYILNSSKYGVSYKTTKDSGKYKKYYDKYFAEYDSEIDRIINIFMNYDADQAEITATLFAAWNDAIIDKKEASDEEIVDDVLNNWNESKKRFSKDIWLCSIAQMHKNNLIPKGYGKHTVVKS